MEVFLKSCGLLLWEGFLCSTVVTVFKAAVRRRPFLAAVVVTTGIPLLCMHVLVMFARCLLEAKEESFRVCLESSLKALRRLLSFQRSVGRNEFSRGKCSFAGVSALVYGVFLNV